MSGGDQEQRGVLVIQPLPGIGDMIWHLPLIHAIADSLPERKVTVLSKPRSQADRLLIADPAVERVLWVERKPGRHDGFLGLLRLGGMLRKGRFRQVWILHDSARYALAAWLAGIPERTGYGSGLQRRFLSRTVCLTREQGRLHPVDKADAFRVAQGLRQMEPEPRLVLAESARQRVRQRWSLVPKPWVALGIATSESIKQWGAENFAHLAGVLAARGFRGLFVTGGPDDRRLAEEIIGRADALGIHMEAATGQPLEETAALLEACDYYIGNDTGILNVAAAVSTPALGLFGASEPLTHSIFIDAVTPDHPGAGMAGITVEHVLCALERMTG
jgi:heptosyltransferase-2